MTFCLVSQTNFMGLIYVQYMGQPQVSHLYFPAKTQRHPHNNIPHPQDIKTQTKRGAVPELSQCISHTVTTVVINNKSAIFLQMNLNADVLLGVQLSVSFALFLIFCVIYIFNCEIQNSFKSI